MSKKWDNLMLALCIALLPPVWAVLAPHIHVSTGAVALICAGVYVANGNRAADGVKITTGFLLGDFWAWAALHIMDLMQWNPELELFVTLFVMGGLAVLISGFAPKWIYCPSWLCGWAIGLTVMSPLGMEGMKGYPLQIAAAMLAGVWYVGVLLDKVQRKMLKLIQCRSGKE